jgi:hypothetical protein
MFEEMVDFSYEDMLNRFAIAYGLTQFTFLMGDKSNEFRATFGVLDIDGDAWIEEQDCIVEALASGADEIHD